MARIHFNNFRTTLNGSITNVATSITLSDSIPSLSGGTVYLTIYGGGVFEIISIASNSGAPTYTVTRGLEGTTAVAWPSGAKVECRVTRDSIDTKQIDLSNGTAVTLATPAANDLVLFQDVDDNNELRAATAEDVGNLASGFKYIFLGSQVASASPHLNFTSLGSLYSYIDFVLVDLIPATDNQRLTVRTSTDNGVNYDASAGNYAFAGSGCNSSPTTQNIGSASATQIELAIATGNDTNEAISGKLTLFDPSTTSLYHRMIWSTISTNNSGGFVKNDGGGLRLSTTAINAIRFMFASGNITSGTIYAYGALKL